VTPAPDPSGSGTTVPDTSTPDTSTPDLCLLDLKDHS
jgi:hypothetical protein